MYRRGHHFHLSTEAKSLLFGLFMLLLLLASLGTAAVSHGPLVLGSEMNGNGLVEYLCIGRGCDHLY